MKRKWSLLPFAVAALFFSAALGDGAKRTCGFNSALGSEFREFRRQNLDLTKHMHDRLMKSRWGSARLQSVNPRPIRIHADLQIESLSTDKQQLLNDTVLPIAFRVLQEFIQVKRPVQGNLTLPVACKSVYVPGNQCAKVVDPDTEKCGHAQLKREHYGEYETCSLDEDFNFICERNRYGYGIPDADFVIYVTAENTNDCGEGTAAFAHHCETDVEENRPLSGSINMCPGTFFAETETLAQQIETVVHEILHALVFNPDLWTMFIDDAGDPVPPSQVRAVVQSGDESSEAIVSQHAVVAARLHFGCDSLGAISLENQGASGTAGAHWDSRYLQGELMDPIAGSSPLYNRHTISNITLGLIEDSGWYKANFENAGYMRWGKDAGCDFVTQSCSQYAQSHPDQQYFCSSATGKGCVMDKTAVGQCTGSDMTMDGCMTVEPFVNADCLKEPSGNDATATNNIFLEAFGPDSRCIGVEAPFFRNGYGFNTLVLPFRCYRFSCVNHVLYVDVGGTTARCPSGEMLEMSNTFDDSGFSHGRLGPCPSNEDLCPSLACANHCNQKGTCVNGVCHCYLGYAGEDCASQLCIDDHNCPGEGFCKNGGCSEVKRPSPPTPSSPSPSPSPPPSRPPPPPGRVNPQILASPPPPPPPPPVIEPNETWILEVEAELRMSEDEFTKSVRTAYRGSLARAAGVGDDSVSIIKVSEKSVDQAQPLFLGTARFSSPDRPQEPADSRLEPEHKARKLMEEPVLEVVSHVLPSGNDQSVTLESARDNLEANWNSTVVDEMKDVGVDVIFGRARIVNVAAEKDSGDEVQIFGWSINRYYLFIGAIVAAGILLCICCSVIWCCCCSGKKKKKAKPVVFTNLSASSQRSSVRGSTGHSVSSQSARPLQSGGSAYMIHKEDSMVDFSDVSVTVKAHPSQSETAKAAAKR